MSFFKVLWKGGSITTFFTAVIIVKELQFPKMAEQNKTSYFDCDYLYYFYFLNLNESPAIADQLPFYCGLKKNHDSWNFIIGNIFGSIELKNN